MPHRTLSLAILAYVTATIVSPAPLRASALPAVEERVRVPLRMVDFLVIDRRGDPVTDLRREEVELWDDGRRQEILDLLAAEPSDADGAATGFRSTVAPEGGSRPHPSGETGRWIVFLFDARNLSHSGRVHAGQALERLVDSLRPQDRIALMVDDEQLRFVVPFTTRHEMVTGHLRSPEGIASLQRDLEQRLEDLRDATESCRDASQIVACAQQAATNFLFETREDTEDSLRHLEALLRSLAAIPERKIVFYVSEGLIPNPGDVASAAVQHAIGQHGYSVSQVTSFLRRDYSHRLDGLYELASRSRVGLYVVNTMRKMVDDLFTAERAYEGGPDNLPQARTDPFEATWQQVHAMHRQMAQATGAVPVFRRDPSGAVEEQLRAAAGVYTATYTPRGGDLDRRKVRIEVSRPGTKVLYRGRYRPVPLGMGQLSGRLTLEQSDADRAIGIVRAEVVVPGRGFMVDRDQEQPVSTAAFYFEIRDGEGALQQDLFEMIAFPRERKAPAMDADLRRPFAVKVPPGRYVLTVEVSDVLGNARGSFSESFSVEPEIGLVKPATTSEAEPSPGAVTSR
jgi:VWFA-related protein